MKQEFPKLKITTENCFYGMHPELVMKTTYAFIQEKDKWHVKITVFRYDEKATSKRITIDKSIYDEFISSLSKIRINIPIDFEIGCDGGFKQIEFGDYSGGIKLRWWSVAPKGWERINSITCDLILKINEIENSQNKSLRIEAKSVQPLL